ncbi:cytochrome P450 [Collybia nuda]|uniref:Cytochrome P450 n=1 Tax=Collybia nuda TaxID=64659 RepID=A0A9P5YHC7_9AGAR|nr:cytochrome P450 [Collybia nuda]
MGIAYYPYTILVGTVITLILWSHVSKKRSGLGRLPLPPGPKGYPLVGSFFDMPRERPWLEYDKWGKVYGDMVYFKVLGQGYLILGSNTRVNDILEKRSANYSDRTSMPMLLDLMGWDFNMTFLPYGPKWRRHRRAFHKHFHGGAVGKYQPVQFKETHAFLRRLLTAPEDFMHHVQHASGATIMDIVYGIKVSEKGDPYLAKAEQALQGISEAGMLGHILVDLLPFLKRVPNWMPGAGFKRRAAFWKSVNMDMVEKPFARVEESLREGNAAPSLAASLIEALPSERNDRRAEEEQLAKDITAVAYIGGADTTVSAVQFFFLAMAMYPDVQRKGQAEIDAVIGSSRLPGYGDRSSLPYINGIVKETMRWQLVSPLGFGHMCSNDDEYNGYLIPKGTLVLGNAWTILHDPKTYPSPDEFQPERWLKDGQIDPDIQDPTVAAFGFGRRICPGRYFSDNSMYIMIALVLSVYNIRPPVDDQGNPVNLKPEPTSGLLSFPAPFKCSIKPRSQAAENLIREERVVLD